MREILKPLFFALIVFLLLTVVTLYLPKKESLTESEEVERSPQSLLSVSGSERAPSYTSLAPREEEPPVVPDIVSLSDFLQEKGVTSRESVQNEPIDTSLVSVLRAYGNAVGAGILAETEPSVDEVALLKDFALHPTNEVAQKNFQDLGKRYIRISEHIQTVTPPEVIAEAHTVFASTYADVGHAMVTFSQSSVTPQDLSTYNNAISPFGSAFLGVAHTLRAYGVVFNDTEPGSIFTLPL